MARFARTSPSTGVWSWLPLLDEAQCRERAHDVDRGEAAAGAGVDQRQDDRSGLVDDKGRGPRNSILASDEAAGVMQHTKRLGPFRLQPDRRDRKERAAPCLDLSRATGQGRQFGIGASSARVVQEEQDNRPLSEFACQRNGMSVIGREREISRLVAGTQACLCSSPPVHCRL
jgi:hypothetical protein